MGSALRNEDAENTYTYADYKEWELKEGERYELIHGEAFAMASPNFRTYASTEKAAVGIFPDLTVDLEAVFAG